MGAREYPQSNISAFEQGCKLDLRARLAIDLLKSPGFSPVIQALGVDQARPDLQYVSAQSPAQQTAGFALDLATALLEEAEKRGLIKDIPDTSDLSAPERRQAERNGKFNAIQQFAANKAITQEAATQVQVPRTPLQS